MVVRDFVNHHDHAGAHVKCLHWVMMWRDMKNGPIKRLKLRHYCSDKKSCMTDSYYQADVTDFHFDETNAHCPKLFEPFHTIIFVGDHGPHFASHDTMYNESTLSRRFGKKVKLMYLASYHAYSRADGSGAEDSTGLRRDLRLGFLREGAQAMTDMTNSSNDPASWAYNFPQINRSWNVFPPGKHFKHKDRAKWIKKWCEVKFDHPDDSEKYDGILQYRLVTGQGEWQWTDLVAASRDAATTMCDRCSTKDNTVVYHQQTECPAPQYIHTLPTYRDLQPDPNRIQGEQVPGNKKRGGKGPATFACKFKDCEHHKNKRKAFRSATAANRHMRIEHKPTDAEWDDLAYIDGAGDIMVVPKPAKKKGKEKKIEESFASGEETAESLYESSENTEEHEVSADENSVDENKDGDLEEDDPDEEVEIGEDHYVIEDIVGHRMLSDGSSKYRVQWVNTDVTTWEPEKGLSSALRSEYHQKQATEAEAKQARPGSIERAKRVTPSALANAARNKWVSDQLVINILAGANYYNALEAAQKEYDNKA